MASIALEQALLLGETTGVALVDLVLEAKRGSDQALTRLPEGLRNALPLLPDPPARDPAESGREDSEDSALIHRWPP